MRHIGPARLGRSRPCRHRNHPHPSRHMSGNLCCKTCICIHRAHSRTSIVDNSGSHASCRRSSREQSSGHGLRRRHCHRSHRDRHPHLHRRFLGPQPCPGAPRLRAMRRRSSKNYIGEGSPYRVSARPVYSCRVSSSSGWPARGVAGPARLAGRLGHLAPHPTASHHGCPSKLTQRADPAS
jgi:hypothetical protein